MGLQPGGQVVETGLVGNSPFDQTARQIVDLVRQFLPHAIEEFVGRRIAGSLDWMVLNDHGIQLDHFVMIVQHGYSNLSCHIGWKRSDVGELRSFRHLGGLHLSR